MKKSLSVRDTYISIRYFLPVPRTTRLLLFFLLVCFSAVATGFSQKLVISAREVTLQNVFKQIEKQTHYTFLYDNEVVKEAQLVSIEFSGTDIRQLLDEVLKNHNLTYSIKRNRVMIKRSAALKFSMNVDLLSANHTIRREGAPVIANEQKMVTGQAVSAREKRIKGKVTDEKGEGLPGVNVLVKGTQRGTITDIEGDFDIEIDEVGTVLVFSSVGYMSEEFKVGSENSVQIILKADEKSLGEIVVVGYGTQKKTSLTAAVSTLKGQDIATIPITNLSNGLGGRMSGVIVKQGSGEPGNDGSSIYIRGIATTGASQPLLIVDGIPRSFQELNPATIESFTILKDAAAVAPYGVAAANGVVLVTTKRGKIGAPSLTYNNSVGFQNPTILPKFTNSFQYASLRNAASINEGNPPRFSEHALSKFKDGSDPDAFSNSNALEEMVNKNTVLTTHNLELSGGSERIKYYTSLGYQYQAGIWGPTNQNRYNFSLNLDAQATSTTKISVGINGRQQKNNYPSIGSARIFELIKYVLPINPIRFSNGLNAHFPYGSVYASGYSRRNALEVFSQLSVEQQLPFIPGLSVKGQIAYDPSVVQFKTWVTPVKVWSIDTTQSPYKYIEGVFGQDKPSLTQSMTQSAQLTYQASVNYVKEIGKSNISGLILYESKSNDVISFGAVRNNFNLGIDELNMGSSSQADISNSGYSVQARQFGLVYRVTYDYNGKYLVEASGRYDGSYYFAPGKRFGFFPSFSAGWRLSEEDFIKNNFSWVDNFKIRGSYGEVGALAGGPFQYLSSYYVLGPAYAFGGNAVQGVGERNEANPNITWERARKTNIGLEVSLWKGLLSIETDFFYEKRSNMLANPNVIVPVEYGIGLSQENAAIMKNQGIDLSVSSRHTFTNGLDVSLTGNFTYAKNALLQVFETDATYSNPNRRVTGRALGSQFGLRSLGFFQQDDFLSDGTLRDGIAIQPWGQVRPGDVRYEDLNGDNKINDDDLTFIGNPQVPQIIYGLSPNIRYKNFTVDVLFQGAAKTSFIGTGGYNWAFFNNMNVLEDNLDYWTPENTNAKYPRITNAPTPNNTQASDFWMQNAGYLRLKSATISYAIPAGLLEKLSIGSARIFVAGQNLLTWSKIKNYDPETVNAAGNGYPQQKVVSVGLNLTF